MDTRRLRFIALTCALLMLLSACKKKAEDEPTYSTQGGLTIGYASEGVTVIDNVNELQRAVDEAYAKSKEPGIGLLFQNDAYSVDGVHFTCSIGNSDSNEYDMFIAIYSDMDFTEEIFVSQLLRPGTKFERLELNRALEVGDYRLPVVFTQVVVEDGEAKIHAQTSVTMDFHVLEE